jgi:CDP-Glycerol:Poly(glycerophosphate) glycerophosphotransferase
MKDIRAVISLILNKLASRRLVARLAGKPVPTTPIAVYFGDGPSNLYQLRRWYRALEALNVVHPVVILTSDPQTYRGVSEETSLPVGFAAGVVQLGTQLTERGVRVVLYPNHSALNFRMLRFSTPVHVFIGHGESAKESSVSRQLKAYDFTFVASSSSLEQLRSIRGYDADAAAVVVGSPWLETLPAVPASWQPDGRTTVLYAPTWEGDRPTMDYASVVSLGETMVAAILAEPRLRLIYRPHPWLGRVRKASAAADARIRAAITASNRSDLVDTGEYGWVLAAADVCVTDVSSVAHDWRAMGKPLFITVPSSTTIAPVPQSAYDGATPVGVNEAPHIAELCLAAGERKSGSGTAGTPAPTSSPAAFIDGVSRVLTNS